MKLWRAHWPEFVPFLAFPPEVRRVIYTTNLIESMNSRLCKVTRNRGQFPSEQAALKCPLPRRSGTSGPDRRAEHGDRSAVVESARGAVLALLPVRFPGPLAEPGVRLSTHRALHGFCR